MESDASMIIFSIYLNLQTPRSLEVLGQHSFLQKEIFFFRKLFLKSYKNAENPNFCSEVEK